ncbi:MAG TPA: cardiolipin synthase [Syntrophorhabdales bacterium]|nr:cardiolipin synthase [Syntrophorhabdales bacterium]
MRRISAILSSFLLLVVLYNCASLPDANDVIYGPLDLRSPTVVGPRGELSPEQSKHILDRLGRQSGSTDLLTRQTIVLEEISGSPLIAGNKATLLIDGGATYGAMMQAIDGARDHINFETFIFEDDDIGRRFADLLVEKQGQGVQVNLIYDSVGSMHTSTAFFKRLRDSGAKVLEFNPLNPLKAKKVDFLTHRDHRKILIVDGKIAFTGGVNISGVYSSSPSSPTSSGKEPWRDTDVQIEGPAVAELQKLFLDTWKRQKGPELAQTNFFPELKRQGSDLIQVIGSTPGESNRETYIMYISAITFAEKSVHLTDAYFVPDSQTMTALTDAAKRGVDVRLIVPGVSDSDLVFYAGRSHYEDLLESGVKLYERKGGMLHAKTAVIDSVWSTVGSTNLDLWSFARNDEVNAIIIGQDFAVEMESMFAADIQASQGITPEEWRHRGVINRIKEWFSRLLSYWL